MEKKSDKMVSVILPTYNRSRSLDRAMKSVLGQTYSNIELIIIDDGSNDRTEEIVTGFKDERLRYIELTENSGAAAARNEGIALAKGEFIAFQDSDDEWFPEKLQKQMSLFQKAPENVGVVYSRICRVEKGVRTYIPSEDVAEGESEVRKKILTENFISLPSAVVRKECLLQTGLFDESLPCLQDWDLWIRISKTHRFMYLKEELVTAFYEEDNISLDLDKIIKARKIILEKHFKEFKEAGLLLRRYVSIAHLSSIAGNMKDCRKYLGKAVLGEPLSIYSYFAFIISIFGKNTYAKILLKKYGKFKR
jgi:glycosyltransferase involved in cell wall biosynthesis